MMNDRIYQIVFDEIIEFLPHKWERVIIYLEHGEESYSYSFYVKTEGSFKKCFDLDVEDNKLFFAFANIEKQVSRERMKLDECWSNMTLVVDNEGSMKVEFDYTDFSNGNYQYKKMWKDKYLK